MRGSILTIAVNGDTARFELDRRAGLDDLRAAVGGGYIEVIPGFNKFMDGERMVRCVAFCDEHGKLKRLPRNPLAQAVWSTVCDFALNDHLVGPVAIVWGDRPFMEAL